MTRTLDSIRELASQLVALQKQARSLGLFPGDRELLECPKRGLLEDVLMGGKVMTYHSGVEGQGTGFRRFEDLSEGRFRCAGCGSMVQEE